MELKAASARGLSLFYEKKETSDSHHRPPPLDLQVTNAENIDEPFFTFTTSSTLLNPLPTYLTTQSTQKWQDT